MFKVTTEIHDIFCGGNAKLARHVFDLLVKRGHNVLLTHVDGNVRREIAEVLA